MARRLAGDISRISIHDIGTRRRMSASGRIHRLVPDHTRFFNVHPTEEKTSNRDADGKRIIVGSGKGNRHRALPGQAPIAYQRFCVRSETERPADGARALVDGAFNR